MLSLSPYPAPFPFYFLPTPRLPIPPLTSMLPVSGALQLKTSGAHADCPMAAHTWPYSSADSPAPSSPRWQHSATTDVSRMEEAPWAVCWGGGEEGWMERGKGEKRQNVPFPYYSARECEAVAVVIWREEAEVSTMEEASSAMCWGRGREDGGDDAGGRGRGNRELSDQT